MTSSFQIERTRESMLAAVKPTSYQLEHADRRRREAAHRERWTDLAMLERVAGLRSLAGPRQPFAVGTRVLSIYPIREGVTIDYASSNRTNGDTNGGEALVRWASGFETIEAEECLVDLNLEGELR